MSASNYIISSGESLDDIFEKRNSQQDKADATNYYNTDGKDLNVIFLKKSSSSTATTTNYKVSEKDLNTFFEPLNTSRVGSIVIWPSEDIPEDYLLCDGTSYSTTTYSSLYSAIGTTYGSGSGTFKVPDFTNNSKTFMSSTYSNYTGGNNSLDLSQSQYGIEWASHNHTIDTSTIDFTHTHTLSEVGSGTQYTGALGTNYMTQINNDGDGDFQFLSGQQLGSGGAEVQTMTLNSEAEYTAASIPGQSNNTPSSRDSTIEILNPYITINYIIKYQ